MADGVLAVTPVTTKVVGEIHRRPLYSVSTISRGSSVTVPVVMLYMIIPMVPVFVDAVTRVFSSKNPYVELLGNQYQVFCIEGQVNVLTYQPRYHSALPISQFSYPLIITRSASFVPTSYR